jgi:hypothetical protein
MVTSNRVYFNSQNIYFHSFSDSTDVDFPREGTSKISKTNNKRKREGISESDVKSNAEKAQGLEYCTERCVIDQNHSMCVRKRGWYSVWAHWVFG